MTPGCREPLLERMSALLEGRAADGIIYHGLGSLAIDLSYRSDRSQYGLSRLEGLVSAADSQRVLQRVRATAPGRLLIVKGPEIAARYPAPHHRAYSDLDVLAERPADGYRALLAAGWSANHSATAFECTHQFPALVDGATSLPIEVHRRLAWPAWVRAPRPEVLLERAVPSRLGIAGLETLDPVDHTLHLAAHSWLHRPFRVLRDLLDVELLRRECDARELELRAREWGLERLWRLTVRACDHLLGGTGRCPVGLALLGRHVLAVRRTSRRSEIVMKAFGRFAVTTPSRAISSAFVELATKVRRDEILPRRSRVARDVERSISQSADPRMTPWTA